jgi:hypothetical protein
MALTWKMLCSHKNTHQWIDNLSTEHKYIKPSYISWFKRLIATYATKRTQNRLNLMIITFCCPKWRFRRTCISIMNIWIRTNKSTLRGHWSQFNLENREINTQIIHSHTRIRDCGCGIWHLLWSSGQSSWLQIQRSRVRFPALPNFLRCSESGTGSTQPREYNWGAIWMEK